MNDKKYLKWYNKVGYGSGDIAGNVVYALLSVFVMIYLTDTAGLNAGVIGTLMMLARIFDDVSDIFFGILIDKTRTRMGRARSWMLSQPIPDREKDLLLSMGTVPLERLIAGGIIGPLAAVLYIIGFYHLFLRVKKARRKTAC